MTINATNQKEDYSQRTGLDINRKIKDLSLLKKLFLTIYNNFGFRHNNDIQKTDYDEKIWLSWMFYHYLSTIHVYLRILERENNQ
jgi:hypothetical protein